MDGRPPARERQPFHVPALRASEAEYPLLREYVERERIDALLVDHHEALAVLANGPLEVHDLTAPLVEPLPLALDEPLALLGGAVEEATLDLRLLVLEGHVARHDVTVRQDLRHVRMTAAVIEHDAVDEAGIGPELALHGHDLDHVQVHGGFAVVGHNALDGVHDRVGYLLGEVVLELGLK